ncbi:MAG: PCRF domain-containing protein, partial [Nitrospirota bacterium]
MMDAALLRKWESVASRFQELTDQLMDPSVVSQPAQLHKLSKERVDLEPAAQLFDVYRGNARQLEEAAQILTDPSAGSDMHKMASDETAELQRQQ